MARRPTRCSPVAAAPTTLDAAANGADPWTVHMRRGEFEAAWAFSDAVLQRRKGVDCSHLPRHFQWIWDGTPLDGKRVLVRCYHGLGDTIQFMRFIPVLTSRAAEVIVWMQPALIPLFEPTKGSATLLPLHDGVPQCSYDVSVEIMELPHVLRTTLATLPAVVPYVKVPPTPLPPHAGLAIGLFPRAGDWDARRNLPIDLAARLGRVSGVTAFVLGRDAEWVRPYHGLHVLDVPDTVVDTAGVLAALDLVVTVDSMPAHLAGALGVPTWTLLHADPDWRWMERRCDSPWYPTMRLFRQGEPGNWQPVIESVVANLRKMRGD